MPKATSKSKGKQGRPKRDLDKAASEVVEKFSAVIVGGPTWAVWFGAEFKNNRRSLLRLGDDIQDTVEGTEEEQILQAMAMHKKNVWSPSS